MANIFEPTEPIAPFIDEKSEYQVTIEPVSDMPELALPEDLEERAERSFRLPVIVISIVFLILGSKLANLQIKQWGLFKTLAQGNRIETKVITPPRGVIVDSTGKLLARNIPIYNLELYPALLPKDKVERQAIYDRINKVTGLANEDIVKAVESTGLRSLEPVILKANIAREVALSWQIQLSGTSGVSIDQLPVRSYDSEAALAHVVGYVGKVTASEISKQPELPINITIGKTGLESFYDSYLQGKPGKEQVEVDSTGRIQRVVSNQPALPGNTLGLSLNLDLQSVMTDALAEGINAAGKKKGVAIALNPSDGRILGLVSLPTYDNNSFVDSAKAEERQKYLNDKEQPLFNRAIAGVYPPGSTSKPIWATAGLEEGIIKEETDIQTPPEIKIGDSVFPDWKPHGHADVKTAIAESNNIFFYALGGGFDKIKGLGPNKMKDYSSRFGWGQPTKIDLPGEAKGLIPDPDWKKRVKKQSWFTGDSYHLAIGQGDLLLTPLQLVSSIAAIANGGTLNEPHLVKTIHDPDNKVILEINGKAIRKDIASPNSLRIVREGMRKTVTDGSARPLNDLKIAVAGKTGTAQFEEKGRTHAWFVGFAPYDKPTITLLVMVEGGGDSFSVALPIAKKILSWYSEHDIN